MINPYDIPTDTMFKPIVQAWTNRFEAAVSAREEWQSVVDEIMMFYGKSAAAMFDPGYKRKFWPGKVQPRFRMTVNLAYEFVRVMLPEQIWERPHRTVTPKRFLEIPEGLLDPQTMEQIMAEQQSMVGYAKLQAVMQEAWLNYTSREMPGGGLEGQSSMAVLDALLKGRGVKCIRPYVFPGSNRLITGCFREPPERILLDPDAKTMEAVTWMAIVHNDRTDEVERRFGLPEGMLARSATLESSWSNSELNARYVPGTHHIEGTSNDRTVWYEVYSKCGVGSRRTELLQPVKSHLEEIVGDFAYLAICPAVPWPLNCPIDKVLDGASTEEVREMFDWPIPAFYKDDKWPVEFLDFYPNNNEKDKCPIWPIPPLQPALGEIKVLNYLVPALINRVWTSSRDFWAVAGPYREQLQKEIEKGEDQAFIGIPAVVDDIRKILTIIQQPESRRDMWDLIGLTEDLFRKRTGMMLTAYGGNEDGTQNRSAEETVAKTRAVSATPAYLQKKVVAFESRCASSEAAVARRVVRAPDVEGLFGPTLAQTWDQTVASEDSHDIAAQLDFTVAAASIRRPNRDKDIEDLVQVMQYWLPIDQAYAQSTGDYSPVNATKRLWGRYHDMDMTEMFIPDQSEQMEEAARQQMEQEHQKVQMELAKLQAETQGKQLDAQTAVLKARLEQQAKHLEMQLKAKEGQLNIASRAAELQFDRAKAQQEMEVANAKGLTEILLGRQKLNQQRVGDEIKLTSLLGTEMIKRQAQVRGN